jgi:hypothetical protein
MTISATTQGLRPGVCTSSNRPATPFEGQMIYETDTDLTYIYGGSAWQQVSGGTAVGNSGLVYIGGSTFSASSAVNLDSVFSATYQNYKIEVLITNSSQVALNYRYRVGGASNNTANYGNQYLIADNASVSAGRTTSQTLGDIGSMTLSNLSFFDITLYAPFDAANKGLTVTSGAFIGEAWIRMQNSNFKASTSFDGISFIPASGTITGTARVYGFRQA